MQIYNFFHNFTLQYIIEPDTTINLQSNSVMGENFLLVKLSPTLELFSEVMEPNLL